MEFLTFNCTQFVLRHEDEDLSGGEVRQCKMLCTVYLSFIRSSLLQWYYNIIVKFTCADLIGSVAKDCLLIDCDLVHKNYDSP